MCFVSLPIHPRLYDMIIVVHKIQHTKHWPDFPEVVDELVHQVSTAFPGKDVLVVYVCGADHAVYCSSLLRQNGVGVCVIKRAGSGKGKVFAGNSSSDSLSKLFYAKHITEGSTDFEQFSSTKVCLPTAIARHFSSLTSSLSQ